MFLTLNKSEPSLYRYLIVKTTLTKVQSDLSVPGLLFPAKTYLFYTPVVIQPYSIQEPPFHPLGKGEYMISRYIHLINNK